MANRSIETELVQIGNRKDDKGAISTPVYLSTAYRHPGIGESTGYDYSRTGNPTRQVLEEAIADIDEGDRGFACASGMAAIQTIFSLFSQGDEVLVSNDLYGGSYRLFEAGWRRWGLTFTYLDPTDIRAFEDAITPNTKAIFLETPTNPLMKEADVKAFAELCQEHGILLIVDNTFYTPIYQKPLTQGADIVIHSASKYLSGHNDVIAGLIVTKGSELSERLFYLFNSIGAILSPLDSWLVIRGLKTLSLRMERHTENAQAVADYLTRHSCCSDVIYPGKGGMLSFRVTSQSYVDPFLRALQTVSFAESLGGVESLLTYPITQTHADVPSDVLKQLGVCDRLLRFSIGIEAKEDLINDLEQALARAQKVEVGR